MKKVRNVEMTYFEMLDWYFKRQRQCPISPTAQAVMTHILNECNINYSASCTITARILAVTANVDIRTLKAKLAELQQNCYINVTKMPQDCYKIVVELTKFDPEVCNEGAKMLQNCTQDVGVMRQNGAQIKENKIIKLNKKQSLDEKIMKMLEEEGVDNENFGNFIFG